MGTSYSRADDDDDGEESDEDVEDQRKRRRERRKREKKNSGVNAELQHPASIEARIPTIEVDTTALNQGFVVVASSLDVVLWTLASSILLFGLFLLVQASVEGMGAGWVVLILFGYLVGLLLVFRVILPVPLRWAEAHMHAILARGELESSLFWSFVHRKLLLLSTVSPLPKQQQQSSTPLLTVSSPSPSPPPPRPASPTRSKKARRQSVSDDDNSDSMNGR